MQYSEYKKQNTLENVCKDACFLLFTAKFGSCFQMFLHCRINTIYIVSALYSKIWQLFSDVFTLEDKHNTNVYIYIYIYIYTLLVKIKYLCTHCETDKKSSPSNIICVSKAHTNEFYIFRQFIHMLYIHIHFVHICIGQYIECRNVHLLLYLAGYFRQIVGIMNSNWTN